MRLLLALLTPAALVCAADAGSGCHAADAMLNSAVSAGTPGVAVAVVHAGRVVCAKGYGMADVEKQSPMTPATRVRLASVTKSFTAIAVLQLADRGALTLSDPVTKYFPAYKQSQARVEHLLSHTAGVPDFMPLEAALARPPEFEPGARISYSNNGYQMLGKIVEQASGLKWHEYIAKEVTGPAGMRNTGYDSVPELPGRAMGYLLGEGGKYVASPAQDAPGAWAAGGMYSTAEDMAKFGRELLAGKLLKPATRDRAFLRTKLNGGREAPYGQGWMAAPYRGIREIAHGGDITGYNTWFALYPEHDLVVVALSNVGMRPPGPVPQTIDIAHRIAEHFLGDRMEAPAKVTPIKLSAEAMDRYVGRYELDAPEPMVQYMGRYLTVTRDGDHLTAADKNNKLPLQALSPDTFQAAGSPAEITFMANGEMIIRLMGLREFRAKRVAD